PGDSHRRDLIGLLRDDAGDGEGFVRLFDVTESALAEGLGRASYLLGEPVPKRVPLVPAHNRGRVAHLLVHAPGRKPHLAAHRLRASDGRARGTRRLRLCLDVAMESA